MIKRFTALFAFLLFFMTNVNMQAQDSTDIVLSFEVNMELQRLSGSFDPASDTVHVLGVFNGWSRSAESEMAPSVTNPDIYTKDITVSIAASDTLIGFKFFYTPGNWESNELTAPGINDRFYVATAQAISDGFDVITADYNNSSLADVSEEPFTITYEVNTDGAISSQNNQAFAAVNTVHMTGPIITGQGWPDSGWPDADLDHFVELFDDGATGGDATAGDGIFTTQIEFPAFTTRTIEYKYGINFGDAANNQGGNDNENAVGANHFIVLPQGATAGTVRNAFGEMGTHDLEDVVTDVEELTLVPTEFQLEQNYPNPFNPSTTIRFTITENAFTTLKVYNLLGEEVANLINSEMNPGVYEVPFNAGNLTSGIYLYTLTSGQDISTQKMLLIK